MDARFYAMVDLVKRYNVWEQMSEVSLPCFERVDFVQTVLSLYR